jgi:hypothetical protein
MDESSGTGRPMETQEEEVLWLGWYEGFDFSNCIDFDSQDEVQYNFGPT